MNAACGDAPRRAVVVGAGIVGAACAEGLARAGVAVRVLDAGRAGGGATAAGMGHVLVLDDSAAQLALTCRGRALWDARAADWPPLVGRDGCGTIWVATDDAELDAACARHAWFAARGVDSAVLDRAALYAHEPELRAGLAGGLLVPGDSVVYPPAATRALLASAAARGAVIEEQTAVRRVAGGRVHCADGSHREADVVVVAAGVASAQLVDAPSLTLQPKKGHLAITARCPGFIRHQLVEMGYLRSAHGAPRESVAFNVQPRRASGQVLLGSSRQIDVADPQVEPEILGLMIARGVAFLPGLAALPVIRCWAGFRPATPDNLPVIGPLPGDARSWVAAGHEGLGITTSLATAELLVDRLLGRRPALDPAPYDTARLAKAVVR